MAVGAITRRGQPGATLPVLSRAVAFWKASAYSGSGDLLDLSGNGLHAVLAAGVGTPLFLSYTDAKYFYFPGTTGNFLSTPDVAALDISDVDIAIRLAASDWTPAAATSLVAKYSASGTARAYRFNIRAGAVGAFGFDYSLDGAAAISATSTVGSGGVDGSPMWVRVTRNATTGEIFFYTAADSTGEPAVWTQLGAAIAGTAGALNNSAQDLRIAADGDGNVFAGVVRRVIVRGSIGGAAVFDSGDPLSATEPYASFVDATGKTVTVNRSASGRKVAVVDRPMFLFGTDDYMEVADDPRHDFAATESFTIAAAFRSYGSALEQAVIAKRTTLVFGGGALGWVFRLAGGTSPRIGGGDGTLDSSDTGPSVTVGAASLVAGVRSVTADTWQTFTDGTTNGSTADTTTGSLANAEVVRIGRLSGAGTNYADMEFVGAAIFREALPQADIAALEAEFGVNA